MDYIIWQRDIVLFSCSPSLPTSLAFHFIAVLSLIRLRAAFVPISVKKKKTAGQKATTAVGLPVAVCCNTLSCLPSFLRVCFEETPLTNLCSLMMAGYCRNM
jgi:hypothetical protein